MSTIEKRQAQLEEFLMDCFNDYAGMVKFNISSDEHTDDYTAFNVVISNTKDSQKDYHSFQVLDYSGGIEVLKGEDFHATTQEDFMAFIYLNLLMSEYTEGL
jgi:hypothetical protein